MMNIAKVVVGIALDREFDYIVPGPLQACIRLGSCVRVPFGPRETQGYVVGFSDRSERSGLKSILAPVGDRPLLSENMLRLARWIADYYAATIEQAIRSLLPCAVRRHGARFREQVSVAPAPPGAGNPPGNGKLTPKQAKVLDLLRARGEAFLNDLAREAGCTPAVIGALAKRGLVTMARKGRARDPFASRAYLPTQPLALTPEQAAALDIARRAMDTLQPPVMLLHGVTGSGKTEVYLQAIRHALDKGKGAIVLVPEIALTPQTVERFRGRFGDTVAVLHSHLSDGERHDEWYRIFEGRARIAIGARSALFAPVESLGLIVVDEEHEPSYKQAEAPRYNARDVAVMRGRIEGCAVLLGSASPALESFQNTMTGKYGLVSMNARVDNRKMPVMRIVDQGAEAAKTGKPSVLSQDLVAAMRERLENSEQTILFLNRRGFATSLTCPKCGFVAGCGQCSISLTYHKQADELRCHICGAVARPPAACPKCSDPAFKYSGVGTERVERVVRSVFPKARVQRMDLDTTRRKEAYEQILGDFRARRIDILIGTQMIAKGLDFPGVTLVGVIHADLSLNQPDFRASERTFQLLVQVAGRAGRGDVPGEVIVQTFSPTNAAIQMARRRDFRGFIDQEVEFRRELFYPPFSHIVCVTLEGRLPEAVAEAASGLAGRLKSALGPEVVLSGPMPAPLSRVKGKSRQQVLMRAKATSAMTAPLKAALGELKIPRAISVIVDVDAISMM